MTSTPSPIRILVVDDHAALREGVAAMCSREPDIEIVGENANGRGAIATYSALRPHVMLLDLVMPDRNGMEVIDEVRKLHPDARIIVLTTYEGDAQAGRGLRAG